MKRLSKGVTIVSEQQTGTVLHVGQDRKKETRKGWEQWLSWAVRSRLDPIKKVAKTIKVRSRGFRNKERFANAIYIPSWWIGSLS